MTTARTSQPPRHRPLQPAQYQLNSRVGCTVKAEDGEEVEWSDKRTVGSG